MNVAVLDFGKTNSKLFVFGQDGRILDERRTQPKWVRQGGFSVLDEAELHDWALGAVADAVNTHGVEGLMVSGHGCTFALVAETVLTHPILDYEQEPPGEIATRIDRRIPDFAETFSGWRNSPPDAAVLGMPNATRAGLAEFYAPNSAYGVYWILVLGS